MQVNKRIPKWRRFWNKVYKWALGITVLANATAGCNFFGKSRKTVKCIRQKIRKTAIIVDKNRKPKTKLEKTCKLQYQNRKTAVFSAKTENPNQKLAKSAKTKIPTPPSVRNGNLKGVHAGDNRPRKINMVKDQDGKLLTTEERIRHG